MVATNDSHRTETANSGITQPPGWYMLSVFSLLMGFASISTDLYLPAMPQMSLALHAAPGMIEWTVSGYLIGFSTGQLLWGPIGDRYGRKLSVGIGLVLFVAGSAGCALASDVQTLIIWRIIQALGACASVALSRAMVSDIYEGNKAAQMLSTLITVMAIAPLIGPLAGGQIVLYAGWRAIFWTLVGIGLVTIIMLLTIPETLPVSRRNKEPIGLVVRRYVELLRNPRMLGYAGTGGFFFGGIFAYIAGTPFAYIDYYKVPAQLYGLLFGLGIIGIMAANLINSRLVVNLGYDRILLIGTRIVATSAIFVVISARTGWGGIWGLVVPLLFYVSASGFVVANSIAGAMANFPERTGAVSALIGSIQYGSGILGSGLVGAFSDGTPWPMGCVIGIAGIGSLLSMALIKPVNSDSNEIGSEIRFTDSLAGNLD